MTIAGLDYVKSLKTATPSRKIVVNMSLGGGFYGPVNTAVDSAVAAGIVVVVAAGNSNVDACTTSPAAAVSAITVGASEYTTSDTQATFSNWGTCVDMYAPGVNVLSLSETPGTVYYASGTSMATPHVAGVMALYLEAGLTSQDMLNDATSGLLTGLGPGSPNKMLYVGRLSTVVPKPPTMAPVRPPTKAPTKAPIKPPTRPPTKSPVKPPTMAPVKLPTKAPIKPPTRAPVKPPTKAPTATCRAARSSCTNKSQCCSQLCRNKVCA
jgi:subtilisin family serine protease